MNQALTRLSVLFACALCHTTLLAQNFYYEAVTQTQVPGFVGGGEQISTVHAWVDGDKARIEFQDSAAPGGAFQAGSYLLTTDGGSVLYLVDPEEKTYSEIDLGNLFSTVNAAMEAMGGVVQMEFTDFSNEQLLEEPGDTILGYPTTHYQYRTGYTMNMSIMGMSRENRSESENDFWCSSELNAAGLHVWLRPDRFRTGNEEFDQLIEQGMGNLDCLPLRSQTVTRTINNNQTSETTSTTEVTVFREEAVAEELFAIPPDFVERPFAPEVPDITGPSDEGSGNPFGMGFGMGLGDLFGQ